MQVALRSAQHSLSYGHGPVIRAVAIAVGCFILVFGAVYSLERFRPEQVGRCTLPPSPIWEVLRVSLLCSVGPLLPPVLMLFQRLTVSDEGIVGWGLLGRRHLRWTDVTRVSKVPFRGALTIYGRGIRLLSIDTRLTGIAEFARAALAHVPASAIDPAALSTLRILADDAALPPRPQRLAPKGLRRLYERGKSVPNTA